MSANPQASEAGDLYYRVRFHAAPDDYRPITFPPPGPYWCSGSADEYSVIVAYVKHLSQVRAFWPEATEIMPSGDQQPQPLSFTDRFPKPDWWQS